MATLGVTVAVLDGGRVLLARRVPHALRAHAEGRIAYLEDGEALA